MPDLTPDQEVRFNYERGFVKIIGDFSATNHILSYTPIRQLIEYQIRPAVFDGHYYVAE